MKKGTPISKIMTSDVLTLSYKNSLNTTEMLFIGAILV